MIPYVKFFIINFIIQILPNMNKANMIQISSDNDNHEMPKEKKQFNKLVKQINNKKQELLGWKEIIPKFQHKYYTELTPLMEKQDKYKKKIIYLLDSVINAQVFTKGERKKIADIIRNISGELVDKDESVKLKKIYNKYNDTDYDEENAEMQDVMKDMLRMRLGIDLGDDVDISSPEEVMKAMHKKMQEEIEKECQKTEKRHKKKKSAKAIAREKAIEQAEEEMSQSVKSVYRQLSIALHPDKEQDAKEKERKTELMKEINRAYKEKDILKLLELQLQVEQIDQSNIDNISKEKIIHYNQVLNKQLKEVKTEVSAIKSMFEFRFSFNLRSLLPSSKVIDKLSKEVEEMRKDVESAKEDFLSFKENNKNIKAFLRKYRVKREDFDGYFPFESILYG